jgi:peptidoglycan/xylan/chitin deacetylase (PgdA/CDA1 family)
MKLSISDDSFDVFLLFLYHIVYKGQLMIQNLAAVNVGREIAKLIPKGSISVFILLSIFAHIMILGSSSAPSYAYSPCRCVIFAMDDLNDGGVNNVELAVMDYFISNNLPFTASIIVSKLANSSDLDVYHKIQEGMARKLFDIAIHGYRHINHALMTYEQQKDDLSRANARLEYLFGKRSNIFIPPSNGFNNHTIEAMADLNITLLSTSDNSEKTTINPYKSQTLAVTNNSRLEVSKVSDQKPLVYHVPFSVSFMSFQKRGLSGNLLVEESLKRINESIATYGYAQVRLHPSDFSQVNSTTGMPINELDTIKFQQLTQLVDTLEGRNIRIISFSDIYPH